MRASIKNLIETNPSGLLELKPSLSIPEYRENFGFNLENTFTIYESRRVNFKDQDWFAFSEKSLENLLKVQEESSGDLLVVYIIETLRGDKVNCELVLTDSAYHQVLNDNSCEILKIHQMYTKFFGDNIASNMAKAN